MQVKSDSTDQELWSWRMSQPKHCTDEIKICGFNIPHVEEEIIIIATNITGECAALKLQIIFSMWQKNKTRSQHHTWIHTQNIPPSPYCRTRAGENIFSFFFLARLLKLSYALPAINNIQCDTSVHNGGGEWLHTVPYKFSPTLGELWGLICQRNANFNTQNTKSQPAV